MESDAQSPSNPKEPSESAHSPHGMPRCPRCGWQDVRLSHSRRPVDIALSLFAIAAFRCRSCGQRFHRFHRRRGHE